MKDPTAGRNGALGPQRCDPFLGKSGAIRALQFRARRYAESHSPILIHGETGTGKGILARWLHHHSARHRAQFVDFNCACFGGDLLESELFGHERGAFTGALTQKRGLLEVANEGTVFFDEIGDMPLSVQPKLLKVIEERRFRRLGDVRERELDVRVISATHQDLSAMAATRQFRNDLLYRINTIVIVLPPLRERPEDIVELARSIAGPTIRFTPAAERVLVAHSWPGNLRELRNVLDKAALFIEGDTISDGDLLHAIEPQHEPAAAAPPPRTIGEWERLHILETLEREGGHVPSAASRLGIPRSSLYKKLKRYLGATPDRSDPRTVRGLGPN